MTLPRLFEAARIVLQPAQRPLLQLAAIIGFGVSLPLLLMSLFSCPGPDRDHARYLTASLRLDNLDHALRRYRADCGSYPASLKALVAGIPLDPWVRPYIYDTRSDPPRIRSYGADGLRGGTGFDADLSTADGQRVIPHGSRRERTARRLLTISIASLFTCGYSVYLLLRE